MKIERVNFDKDFTAGRLTSELIEEEIFTLERRWLASNVHLGGQNDVSCVPNGTYRLVPFKRPKSGLIVPMLVNEDLGVCKFADDLPPEGGRFLILMHPGNAIKDIIGCVASGLWKQHADTVNDSRNAQAHIMQAFNEGDTMLEIVSFDTKEIYANGAD